MAGRDGPVDRVAAGDDIVDDRHLPSGLDGALDEPLPPVLLGFLADREGWQAPAFLPCLLRDGDGQRGGPEGQAPDGLEPAAQRADGREDLSAGQLEPAGLAVGGQLAVEVVRGMPPRREDELPREVGVLSEDLGQLRPLVHAASSLVSIVSRPDDTRDCVRSRSRYHWIRPARPRRLGRTRYTRSERSRGCGCFVVPEGGHAPPRTRGHMTLKLARVTVRPP